MVIYLYKNKERFITGFQSHIQHPEKWDKNNLRIIPDKDYKILLYFLTGREHIKETNKFGTAIKTIGGLNFIDEGDFIEKDLIKTKKVI